MAKSKLNEREFEEADFGREDVKSLFRLLEEQFSYDCAEQRLILEFTSGLTKRTHVQVEVSHRNTAALETKYGEKTKGLIYRLNKKIRTIYASHPELRNQEERVHIKRIEKKEYPGPVHAVLRWCKKDPKDLIQSQPAAPPLLSAQSDTKYCEYLEFLRQRYGRVYIVGQESPIQIDDIFVPPAQIMVEVDDQTDEPSKQRTKRIQRNLKEVLAENSEKDLFFVSGPGTGKTLLLRYLSGILEEKPGLEMHNVPILIEAFPFFRNFEGRLKPYLKEFYGEYANYLRHE
ncbi:MAG: hypothetical protein KC964_17975, partial [Candidatus Omnitrophica bacterium]|nr:hypothetical protein [Candidatus Omnitrophota bacterium]